MQDDALIKTSTFERKNLIDFLTSFDRPTTPSVPSRLASLLSGCLTVLCMLAADALALTAQQVDYDPPALYHPVKLIGQRSATWTQGAYQFVQLQGNVKIGQGAFELTSNEAVVLIQRSTANESPHVKAIVYAEGLVVVNLPKPVSAAGDGTQNQIVDASWLGRLFTDIEIELPSDAVVIEAEQAPAISKRASQAIEQGETRPVQPVQFQEDIPEGPAIQTVISPLTGQVQTVVPPNNSFPAQPDQIPTAQDLPLSQQSAGSAATNGSALPSMPGRTNVDISARDSAVNFNMRIETSKTNPNERVYLGTGGVRVTIESPEIDASTSLRNDGGRQIVVLADNIVGWQNTNYDGSANWELYLEGNVVFNKGTRTIYADQMYYDATRSRGTILNADMLTPVSQYNGLVRLKANVIEQVDQNNLQAYGAAFTSSRMGVPRYWLQSDSISINRQPIGNVDARTGTPSFDPQTGALMTDEQYFVESRNNFLYVSDRPLFYWPRYRANLSDPGTYLEQIRFGNDRAFGFQAHTAWNLFQLLGIRNQPENTRWLGVVDYLSERGLGLGSELDYSNKELFSLPGTSEGFYRSWFINDTGRDNLGRGRTALVPEETFRGNALLRHRSRFEPGFSLRGELGYLSDRNFLEQFYERRWDTEKDYTTGLWLERNVGTQSFNLIADYQLNDFFTQTSWLPRADHYLVGQPLLNGRVVWHSHSHLGYGRFREATAPLDPVDLAPFDTLAWETPKAVGVRAGTRQEFDMPFQVGPVKFVPYVLGDMTYWQEDLAQNDLLRAYGQVGLKSSVPYWKVDPTIQSVLWNVNGLAHKVVFESELFFADASKDLSQLPLYDPLDDDAQEAFRHRFAFNTFGVLPGGDVPLPYDERYFALRSGMQNWVTAPSNEIADDLAVVRFGANQRWQTKRGLPGQERIIDWITFNTHVSLFPKATRDNFGSDWGMFNYDFRWHLGDRLSLVSDGFADFFSQGLRTASVGTHMGRPEVGDLYLGYRMIEGPISSNIVNAAVTYRMSDKWGIRANSSVDFGQTGRIGNALSVLYIGESFLWRVGVNADASRNNVGFQFGIEPRFLTRPRMFRPGGVAVSPAGSRWLE